MEVEEEHVVQTESAPPALAGKKRKRENSAASGEVSDSKTSSTGSPMKGSKLPKAVTNLLETALASGVSELLVIGTQSFLSYVKEREKNPNTTQKPPNIRDMVLYATSKFYLLNQTQVDDLLMRLRNNNLHQQLLAIADSQYLVTTVTVTPKAFFFGKNLDLSSHAGILITTTQKTVVVALHDDSKLLEEITPVFEHMVERMKVNHY